MLNVLILMGRVVRDPELRKTAQGGVIGNITIACDGYGEREDTLFLDVSLFNEKIANNVVKHVKKGNKVAISGRLAQRSYINSTGDKKVVIYAIADSVEFLEPKPVEDAPEVELHELPEEMFEPQVDTDTEVKQEEPKFDPYTGKPLKPTKKK